MLNRNYSSRNFFYTENGSSSNKSKYSLSTISTCNTIKLDQSFELDSSSKGKGNFDDSDLDKNMNNLFLSMDYDMETQSEIQKMNNYLINKKKQFNNNYQQKKNRTIKDLCSSMDIDYEEYLDYTNTNPFKKKKFDFYFSPENKMKELKKLENKYNAQFNTILNEMDNKRINAVNNYIKQREFNKKDLWV